LYNRYISQLSKELKYQRWLIMVFGCLSLLSSII
jgi:hypothetical protein